MSNFVPHSCNLSWLSVYVVVLSLSPLSSLLSFLYSVNEALAVGQAPWEVLGTPGNAKTPFCPHERKQNWMKAVNAEPETKLLDFHF